MPEKDKPFRGPVGTPEAKKSKGKSKIERVKEMNKNLPKDAGGKYTLTRSLRNPGGKIEFKQDRRPKPGRPGFKNGSKPVPNKLKGFSKLPEKVQRKINKKLARKV